MGMGLCKNSRTGESLYGQEIQSLKPYKQLKKKGHFLCIKDWSRGEYVGCLFLKGLSSNQGSCCLGNHFIFG